MDQGYGSSENDIVFGLTLHRYGVINTKLPSGKL